MGDNNAKELLYAIIEGHFCDIETINLQRNNLGFKTGAFIMNLLIQCNETKLRDIDLRYNTISKLVQNSINKLLQDMYRPKSSLLDTINTPNQKSKLNTKRSKSVNLISYPQIKESNYENLYDDEYNSCLVDTASKLEDNIKKIKNY